jgi:thiol-disulfide isomerase/thioredoxin
MYLAAALVGFTACGSSPSAPPLPPDAAIQDQDPGIISSFDALPLSYPEGPYGNSVGALIANLQTYGYRDTSQKQLEVLSLSDFYDPEGVKGTGGTPLKVILVNAVALWCSACKEEAPILEKECQKYTDQGLQCYTAIFEDSSGAPAQQKDIDSWIASYGITFPVALDSAFKWGAYFNKAATPMNMYIDARTMKILQIQEGFIELTFDTSVRRYLK